MSDETEVVQLFNKDMCSLNCPDANYSTEFNNKCFTTICPYRIFKLTIKFLDDVEFICKIKKNMEIIEIIQDVTGYEPMVREIIKIGRIVDKDDKITTTKPKTVFGLLQILLDDEYEVELNEY